MLHDPAAPILQVAVPSPLHGSLDYLPPPHCKNESLHPGIRVLVPFGKRKAVGVLIQATGQSRIAAQRLRPVFSLLDQEPLLSKDLLELNAWASRYYHHPLGEVFATSLPTALRNGLPAEITGLRIWKITAAGMAVSPADLKRAPRQAALLHRLQLAPTSLVPITVEPLRSGRSENRHFHISKAVNSTSTSRFSKGYLVEFAKPIFKTTISLLSTARYFSQY